LNTDGSQVKGQRANVKGQGQRAKGKGKMSKVLGQKNQVEKKIVYFGLCPLTFDLRGVR